MSDKQVAMVIDLNKCIGCQTCTIACKTQWTNKEGQEGMWWNTVSTAPGDGTPKDWEGMGGGFRDGKAQPGRRPSQNEFGEPWEFNVEEVMFGGDPHATLGPVGGDPSHGTNWDEDVGTGDYPNSYFFYIPRICNHCTKPACMEACPRGAIYKRDEDGIVLINEDHCRGFRFCQEACPYKEIYYNTVTGTAQKCIFCLPRVEEGVATACSRQCPGRVRFLGFLDDEDGPIHKLVYQYKVALPLHPEYETQPNVFYIPPLAPPSFDDNGDQIDESRIPMDYLISLFGEEVREVIDILKREKEIKRQGGESDLMDVLISRNWLDLFGPFTNQPKDVARTLEERSHG
jgi:ethylbenzene hydroxylase subunit beta/complex iron-sulfur molybdoenzyme family reductase subunit beta